MRTHQFVYRHFHYISVIFTRYRFAALPSLPAVILIRLFVCGACTSFVIANYNLTQPLFDIFSVNPSLNKFDAING
ncbi:unnamed protein product [Callosobruchus maculatus]|uniref:Uncharacterized protein n=1 Tax=Callosobruchus maculatus TaxID=64391 RepID=A0A653C470_CALMS|nr:unnamed protein product [Callosobruchus maculatus]